MRLKGRSQMGEWGTTLYANDTTQDVREGYMDYLQKQLSNEEAYQKMLEDFEELIGDEDEEPLFWFALAETQWKVGRLTPQVKEKALYWIEQQGGVRLWVESDVNPEGWKKTLGKLKAKLESPMRSEKKIKKPEVIDQNLWDIGDVYAYQFNQEESIEQGRYGKYVLLQKMGEGSQMFNWVSPEEAASSPVMMIHVFNIVFDEIPNVEEVKGLKLLPMFKTADHEIFMSTFMELEKKSHYPKNHLTYLGNAAVTSTNFILPPAKSTFWNKIEERLNYRFSNYQDKEYEEVEEGVFKFTNSES